jgi:hypothetical protein
MGGLARNKPSETIRWIAAPTPFFSPRRLDRLTLAKITSTANNALMNSCGSSIIRWRLDRAPAQNEEGNRRHGAAGAQDCENVLNHVQFLTPPADRRRRSQF